MAAHVRWKSARFIPLGMVQSILAGERLDENRWSVDGPSGCLVPAGRQGPFRTSVRWSAAVDRLSGASERHSTACIEFRPGAGLWTVIGFADEAARDRWQDAVKARFPAAGRYRIRRRAFARVGPVGNTGVYRGRVAGNDHW